jgi:hypothetical protein
MKSGGEENCEWNQVVSGKIEKRGLDITKAGDRRWATDRVVG